MEDEEAMYDDDEVGRAIRSIDEEDPTSDQKSSSNGRRSFVEDDEWKAVADVIAGSRRDDSANRGDELAFGLRFDDDAIR